MNRSIFTVVTVTALVTVCSSAQARSSRVAVTPFDGPGEVARQAQLAVFEIVSSKHDAVSSAEILAASAEAGGDARKPAVAVIVARLTNADAVISGRVSVSAEGYKLAISVREAVSGKSVGAVLIPLASELLDSSDSDRIRPHVLSLLDQAGHRNTAVVSPTVVSSPAADAPSISADTGASSRKKLIVDISGSAGLSMTTRTLSFATQPGLQHGANVNGSPVMGARVDARVISRGKRRVGIEADFDRSIGAKLASADGVVGGFTSPVKQVQAAAALVGEVDHRKATFGARLGYNRVGYSISNRPGQLEVPDAHYATIEVGLRARLAIRDGKVAVFGGAGYHQLIGSAGITDNGNYGSARARGIESEGGFEVRLADRFSVRAGIRALQLTLLFDGLGDKSTNLDADSGIDVAGATDRYISGFAQLAFNL